MQKKKQMKYIFSEIENVDRTKNQHYLLVYTLYVEIRFIPLWYTIFADSPGQYRTTITPEMNVSETVDVV